MDSPIDWKTLEKLYRNDSARQLAILKKFIQQSEVIVTQAAEARGVHDAEQVSFHAHKLKSSARLVGADALADVCMELEVAGLEEDWPAIEHLFSELVTAIQTVKDFVLGL